jgi:hypothetical protein
VRPARHPAQPDVPLAVGGFRARLPRFRVPQGKTLRSLPETPSTGDLLSSQQFGGSLRIINHDFVRWRSPGKLCVGPAVSVGSGVRAPGALAPGDGYPAVATQSAVQRGRTGASGCCCPPSGTRAASIFGGIALKSRASKHESDEPAYGLLIIHHENAVGRSRFGWQCARPCFTSSAEIVIVHRTTTGAEIMHAHRRCWVV